MEDGSSETRISSSPSHPVDARGFAPGTILAERYRVVALVGRGGMGEVYRADDLRLGKPVALKFLPPTLEHDPAARDRLVAEVRSARMVSHPNVCRVYDVGDVAGRVFLTMEYIDGEDLASLLRRIGRLPAAKALEIARQLCAGLAAAHDKGVLHRDLKPANVMIDGRGQARITDFGLAVSATATGSPADHAGTLAYMAPERFRGTPATVQSDVYGLGLILYETYTGKPAFKAGTVAEWQRAHSDSTPTSPAALASDVEPAVERAILRCLDKDPAKRPASAAQVAAALPGGDPLAAALAAGETPSPELVAASGEEGTLPRAKAWAWFAACLITLAVFPLTVLPFNLIEHIAFNLSPDTLQAKAREALQRLGYPDQPADDAWWFRTDDEYLKRVNLMRPAQAAADLRTATPGPLRFCYRQSPSGLLPLSIGGHVTAVDPPPEAGDVYLELDLSGRLTTLRVVPPASGEAQPSSHVNWPALFDVAQLGPSERFAEDAPQWWPESAVDVREARKGVYAGQQVRVEAAARAGRPIFFRLLLPWMRPSPAQDASNGTALGLAVGLALLACLIIIGVLARRNIRLGRGDRSGARRLAFAAIAVVALAGPLETHMPLAHVLPAVAFGLQLGLISWLLYLGFEPAMRRKWPHLLIAWGRLLEGRWRDPLVGRAVLAGVFFGLLYQIPGAPPIYRLLDLPGGGPTLYDAGLPTGGLAYAAGLLAVIPATLLLTLLFTGVLFIVRLIVPRTDLAWLIYALLIVGYQSLLGGSTNRPATIHWVAHLSSGVVFGLILLWLIWKHGALGLAIGQLVGGIMNASPWTLDMSRWYAWRQWLPVAIIVALAVWGFRNVLGRQSAFPGAAPDG